MDNAGMFLGIEEIIDGHPDFKNLVSNCVPLFLFDVNSRFASKELTKGISGKKEESKHNMFIIRCRILGDVINKAYYVKANLGYGALGGFTWVDNFKNTVFFGSVDEAKVFWVKVKSLLGLDKFPLVDPDSVKIVEISLKEKDRLSF